MDHYQCEKFVEIILVFGSHLLESGAEVRRVEDTLERLCDAYGMSDRQVYAVANQIIVTVSDNNGRHYTQQIRVKKNNNNLGKLEKFNEFAREICRKTPDVLSIEKKIEKIQDTSISPSYELGGYIVAASSLTLFYGGDIKDGLAASMVAVLVYYMNNIFSKSTMNNVIYIVMECFIAGILGIILCKIGIGTDSSKVMIGTVMLFIPGLAIVNGVREIVSRDIFTGVFKLVEALMIALAITLGFGLAIFLVGGR